MLDERTSQAIDAAKLYYNVGLSQAQVSEHLGLSRPTVSKLLQLAHDRGYVTITINDPRESSDSMSSELASRFKLQTVRVVSTPPGGLLAEDLGAAGAALLEEIAFDGMSLGLSWGETLSAVAKHLRHLDISGVRVIQLKGGHSHSERSTEDLTTLQAFTRAFNAEAIPLPLPVIFDSATTKEFVTHDRHIAHVLELGRNVDIAVFTAGAVEPEALALNLGQLNEEETTLLLARAVGDVCSRFYTQNGEIAAPEVDQRTVGITFEDLKQRPKRILIAGGNAKTTAIKVALEMGLATHLVIDHPTAVRILEAQPTTN